MKQEFFKVEIPKGYEIDEGNSTFEKIVFKKKDERPMSWDDYCRNPENDAEVNGVLLPYGFAGTHLVKYVALRKLELLCKAWGGGYGYDYGVMYGDDEFFDDCGNTLVSFDDIKTTRLFLETFIGLFEEAKELL